MTETLQETSPLNFEQFYQEQYDRVYRWIYAWVKSREEAEDLAQDTFLKAWRALPTYQPTHNPRHWLYAIARNTALDAIRRKKLVQWQPLPEQEYEQDQLLPIIITDDLTHCEVEELLQQITRTVPAQDMQLLFLTTQGYTAQEAATITGYPHRSIKSRVHRTRQRIQRSCRYILKEVQS